MEWNGIAWLISVAAVVASGAAAWLEGNWTRRPGLTMGFANHGGMWGDLLLLPIANGLIVPHLTIGTWMVWALLGSTAASAGVHHYWYRGSGVSHSPEHMWPARPWRTWSGDLSIAGWLHVLYVIGELMILVGFLLHQVPQPVVLIVTAVFTVHVPIGLLQPRWFVSGQIASLRQQPLLAPLLAALWAIAAAKMY